MTFRSDTTITVSNILRLSASWRSARKWADQAMELVFPDPAECWIRYFLPGPFLQNRPTSFRVASSWWKRGKISLAICPLLVLLRDDVPAEQLQPALALPHGLPEIGCPMPPSAGRGFARAAVVAAVEGQEGRGLALQLRRHPDFLIADREVDQRAAGEAEQRLCRLSLRLRVPVIAVLIDGVLTDCVLSVFSSAVATGSPLRNSTRSRRSRWRSSSGPDGSRAAGCRGTWRGSRGSPQGRA